MSTPTNKTLKSIYTFTFGRNLYTIRLSDIKKATLLKHVFTEKVNDTEDIIKTIYIFSVTGDLITSIDKDEPPTNEIIIEVKAEENDYASLYKVYVDLIDKWDNFHSSAL
jgi:hypothetical protein